MLASLGVWQMVSFTTTCVLVGSPSDVAGDPLSDNHLLLIEADAAVARTRHLNENKSFLHHL